MTVAAFDDVTKFKIVLAVETRRPATGVARTNSPVLTILASPSWRAVTV
jgi:hypothetical protein